MAKKRLTPATGLCEYSDPEDWFDYNKAPIAKRICGNCPVRLACARAALDIDDITDGVWAGVRLPGAHGSVAEHNAVRAQLERIVAALENQPDEHRRRTLAIRAALHHSATRPRPTFTGPPSQAMEPAGA